MRKMTDRMANRLLFIHPYGMHDKSVELYPFILTIWKSFVSNGFQGEADKQMWMQ